MNQGPPSISRRTFALSPVLLILGEARASGSRRAPSFAEIHGSERTRSLLEDAFSILSGRKFFLNDNVWWKYTDTRCNFHGTYGWRPFFDEEYRRVDRNTWEEPFRNQVTKIASIPALTANHLTLVNYPARPAKEFDPGHPPTAPGAHVNGGWFWMCAAGALYVYTRTGRHDLLKRLGELLSDHHQHFSIDGYNNYGADKASPWKERGRDSYSVVCAGSFGMLFRALLGLDVNADGITVSQRVPHECERIKTTAPVYYARKKLRFDIRNRGGEILQARLNGRPYRNHDQDSIRVPWHVLQADNLLRIDLDGSGKR